MSVNGFTPKQSKIVEILSDGLPHSRKELFDSLDNELNSRAALWWHIMGIRKHIRPKGQDIICEYINRGIYYRHVRLLAYPNE